MQAHFRDLRSKSFPMIYETPQSNAFWPLQSLFKNLGVHRDSNSQSGSSLGSVKVHSLIFSYNPEKMRCDSRASHLALTLASPCISRETKVRVAIVNGVQIQTPSIKNIKGNSPFTKGFGALMGTLSISPSKVNTIMWSINQKTILPHVVNNALIVFMF